MKIANLLNGLFSRRDIVNCERDLYLTRWYLFRIKWLAIFLHRFHRSDEDRALHDHPWAFITLILWRGYDEHFADPQATDKTMIRRRWPLTIHYRPATWRHRVELIEGRQAWTLVFRFKEVRDWGFWTPQGFIQWNKWWQKNCE